MSDDKKKRDPLKQYIFIQYLRTFLLFAGLLIIALVIAHTGAK